MNSTYIDSNDKKASKVFSEIFKKYIDTYYNDSKFTDIVILCMGTDRSTGDSLAPMVGYKLKKMNIPNVYGTIHNPVHAKNLEETIETINSKYEKPFIIAIDACLGSINHIGSITIKKGRMKPGSGLNKSFPEVGDVSIAGIVNYSDGHINFMILQNTRLSTVIKIADVIVYGISKYYKNQNIKLRKGVGYEKVFILRKYRNRCIQNVF